MIYIVSGTIYYNISYNNSINVSELTIKNRILLSLLESPKTNAELLRSLYRDDQTKSFNTIDKPLKDLRDVGLVTQIKKTNAKGPGAKPTLNSVSDDFFKIVGVEVSEDDIECVKIGLKYSSTLLKDLIEKNITSESVENFINSRALITVTIMRYGAYLESVACEKVANRRHLRNYHTIIAKNTEGLLNNGFSRAVEYMKGRPIPFLVCGYIDLETLNGTISTDVLNGVEFKNDMQTLSTYTYGKIAGKKNVIEAYHLISDMHSCNPLTSLGS